MLYLPYDLSLNVLFLLAVGTRGPLMSWLYIYYKLKSVSQLAFNAVKYKVISNLNKVLEYKHYAVKP
jgi:hypothetical protein